MITAKIKHDCKEELREMDLRATPTRIAIMQLLEKTKNPIDVSMILDYLKKNDINVDPATVFRIMNAFTAKGLVSPIAFQEGKMRYELGSKEDHHHLICQKCGLIQDIEDNVIPALEKHIGIKHNFKVQRHSLEFFGLCQNCQKQYE